MFYRRVDKENELAVIRSANGVTWSAPTVVLRAPNHEAISPTVLRRAPNDWMMWVVNSGAYGCTGVSTTVDVRRSPDGETWSAPTPVSLVQPGVFPWHIEVQWIPALGEYWALFNAKVAGSCTTDALYFATSADGLTWRTYQSGVYEWHAAFERLRRADLLDLVNRRDAAVRLPSSAPPLTNATAP